MESRPRPKTRSPFVSSICLKAMSISILARQGFVQQLFVISFKSPALSNARSHQHVVCDAVVGLWHRELMDCAGDCCRFVEQVHEEDSSTCCLGSHSGWGIAALLPQLLPSPCGHGLPEWLDLAQGEQAQPFCCRVAQALPRIFSCLRS